MSSGRGKNGRFGAGAGKKARFALLGSALRTRVRQGMARHAPDDGGEPGALSHVDGQGHARMVDVSAKGVTARQATARGRVEMRPETLALIVEGRIPKGDVFATARIAGIMAAKRTHELIPLCHPLPIAGIEVRLAPAASGDAVELEATVRTTAQTGVEMEALTAVSVAALTIYDMCKAVERTMRVTDVRLVAKSGGQSGDFRAD